jgi:hypothetical protein
MRRPDVLDPEVARELDALDAAVAGEAVSPEFEELASLARAVRAERPAVDDGFAERMDERAASGFASARSSRPSRAMGWLRTRPSQRLLLPALGAAASVLAALVVVGSLQSGGRDETVPRDAGVSLSQPQAPGGEAQSPALGSRERRAATPSDMQALTSAPLPAGRARRVEREASLVLTASPDRVPDLADGVVRATDEVAGTVATSSVASGDGSGAGASFQLRIPTRRLDEALAKLSKLGHVRSRTQNSEDVTSVFVSTQERLDAALAERKGLLAQLAQATTTNETESIRARLDIVQSEIAAGRGALARLRVRTVYSAVSVAIEPDRNGGSVGGGGPWTPGDAVRDAVRVLEVIAGGALVGLAVLGPLALLGLLVGVATRTTRRRRREQALSAG